MQLVVPEGIGLVGREFADETLDEGRLRLVDFLHFRLDVVFDGILYCAV